MPGEPGRQDLLLRIFLVNSGLEPSREPARRSAFSIAAGDGYPDVVADSLANRPWSGVEVFADTARGTLKAPVVYPTLDIPAAMAVADLNGDGKPDIAVVGGSGAAIFHGK